MSQPGFDLWYHDGTGFGWPAIQTRRSEETTDEVAERQVDVAFERAELEKLSVKALRALAESVPVDASGTKDELVDALYGRTTRSELREVVTGNTVTTVTRDLIVFYTGPKKNTAGPDGKPLEVGQNVLRDVPEGVPTQRGTCSHIAWQPGTPEHAAMVTHGIAEGEASLLDHADRLKAELAETELALQAVGLQKEQLASEHGIEVA